MVSAGEFKIRLLLGSLENLSEVLFKNFVSCNYLNPSTLLVCDQCQLKSCSCTSSFWWSYTNGCCYHRSRLFEWVWIFFFFLFFLTVTGFECYLSKIQPHSRAGFGWAFLWIILDKQEPGYNQNPAVKCEQAVSTEIPKIVSYSLISVSVLPFLCCFYNSVDICLKKTVNIIATGRSLYVEL